VIDYRAEMEKGGDAASELEPRAWSLEIEWNQESPAAVSIMQEQIMHLASVFSSCLIRKILYTLSRSHQKEHPSV